MSSIAEKQRLLDALREIVAQDLAAQTRRQLDTQQGATHEESRSEHAKDTRATEQSYLARGLADRVADLERTVTVLAHLELRRFEPDDPIAVGALIEVRSFREEAPRDEADGGEDDSGVGAGDEEREETWFLVPGAGGIEIPRPNDPVDGVPAQRGDDGTTAVRTVTPVSPLGRSLLGLSVGDEGALRTPRGERGFEVLSVR